MKQHLTPHYIANTVRMMRPVYSGTIVLVEGDTDARVYRRLVDETHCRVIPGYGKSNVLNALEMLEKTDFKGILAIADSDFWKLNNTKPDSDNLLLTDTHDLETMIISSRALDAVLIEFGSERKIKRTGKRIVDMLLKVALPIGYIRWISSSKQENLSLRFKNLSFDTVIEVQGITMKTDIGKLISRVKKQSRNATLDEQKMKEILQELIRSNRYDPWHVCRGHDMVHILTFGLRRVFGNRHARSISYEQVDSILRIAYGRAEFSRTKLYVSIEQWEKTNPGYRILE
jgi:hypothetical protein